MQAENNLNFSLDNPPARFYSPISMTVTKDEISRVMSALAKRTSPRKAAAARRNGKLGGRPRKAVAKK